MDTTEQIFQLSKFPDTFSFVIITKKFDENRSNLYTL